MANIEHVFTLDIRESIVTVFSDVVSRKLRTQKVHPYFDLQNE